MSKRPIIRPRTPMTSPAEVRASLIKGFMNDGLHFGLVKTLQTRRGPAPVYNIGHEDFVGIITPDGFRQVHTVIQLGPQHWHVRDDMKKLNETRPEAQFLPRPGDPPAVTQRVRIRPNITSAPRIKLRGTKGE